LGGEEKKVHGKVKKNGIIIRVFFLIKKQHACPQQAFG